MPNDPYREMANRINKMIPGTVWRITRSEIDRLPRLPEWAAATDITMGFERVKESVIGSTYSDLWRFVEEPNGDITVYRRPDRFSGMVMDGPLRGKRIVSDRPFYRVEVLDENRFNTPVDDSRVEMPSLITNTVTYVFVDRGHPQSKGRLPGWYLQ